MSVWDTLECDGGTQQAVMPLPFSAEDTFDLEGEERAIFEVDQLDASFADVLHERIIRLVFADGDIQEWRIREIDTERKGDNARSAILTCESIRFDLIHNSNMLERVEANGQVKNHFELYGLTPTQHVDIILGEAPSYFSKGTIEELDDVIINFKEGISFIRKRVDMIYHQDMPLSALVELALVSDLELEITRNGAVDYQVHLYQQRGSLADTLVITHADNLLSQRRRTLSSDMATVVYPRGGQDFGSEGSMENHRFLAAEVSGSTVDFHDDLFSEDDQLNGFFIEDSSGAIIAINDTVAPNQIVLASAPDVTEHSWFTFKRAITTGIGTVHGSLTFLPSPAAQVTFGIKPATLDRPDIPLIDNLIPNPFMQDDAWVGDIPNGFALIGSPAVAKNTDPLYTRHGGASLHVTCNGPGSGVKAKEFRAFMTEASPFLTAQIQLYVVTGQVRLELFDITNQDIFPPTGAEASTIQTAVWIDQFGVAPGGDADDNFFTRGTKTLELRITQIGDTAAEFFLDAVQCAASPSFTEVVYGGRASNDLWLLAKEALETLITPSAEYTVSTIDYDRLGDATYKEIVIGGDVTMVDTELGINFTTRILSRTRDLLNEGLSSIEVEGKTNDLTRITTQTDRRIRRKLSGGVGYDSERDGDGSLGDNGGSTGGGGGGGDGGGGGGGSGGGGTGAPTTSMLADCCEDAAAEHCSPDSAGAYSNNPVCDITVGPDSAGTQISWAAAAKLTITGAGADIEGEVNAAGTLKKTGHNVLLQDALDTKDNVVDDVGSSSIQGGKLRVTGGSRIRFTGFTAAGTIVAQVRFGAGLFPWKYGGLMGRLDATGDGYGIRDQSAPEGTHGLLRLDAGAITMLDTAASVSVGGGSYPESYLKVFVADSLQRGHVGGGFSFPTWAYNATDTAQNGQTGTAGFIVESAGQRFIIWDLIVCPSNEITVTGLDTGFKARCAGNIVTESGGSATVDVGSALFPIASVSILNASDVQVAIISPASGVFGGNTYVYDSAGLLTGESSFDSETRVDLDFLDAGGTLISTATWANGGRSATYERLSGTAFIPTGTVTIRVVHRRVGDAKAISCVEKIMVVPGANAGAWVSCEIQDQSGTFQPKSGCLLLTIPAAAVDADITGFVCPVDLSTIHPSLWTGAAANGEDIFVKQGGTRVPAHVFEYDNIARTGFLFFRADMSSTVDNEFEICWGDPVVTDFTPDADVDRTADGTNMDAEAGDTTGWTTEFGSWIVDTVDPNSGTYNFKCDALDTEAHQDITVNAADEAKVDSGDYAYSLEWFQDGSSTNQFGSMGMEFFDDMDVSLSEYWMGPMIAVTPWEARSIRLIPPSGTRKVRIKAEGRRNSAGRRVMFDDIEFKLVHLDIMKGYGVWIDFDAVALIESTAPRRNWAQGQENWTHDVFAGNAPTYGPFAKSAGGGVDIGAGGSTGAHRLYAGVREEATTFTIGATIVPKTVTAQEVFAGFAKFTSASEPSDESMWFYHQSDADLAVVDDVNSTPLTWASLVNGVSYRVHAIYEGTTDRRIFSDGIERANDTPSLATAQFNTAILAIEDQSFSNQYYGKLGYYYFRRGALSDAWISLEFDLLDDPTAVYTAVEGGTSVAGNYLRHDGSDWLTVAVSKILSDLLAVDGAGSGLDADLLDGQHGAAYALLSAVNVFTDALNRSVESGITASTTQTQGNGPLTKDINEVSVCASTNDTVTLRSAVAGAMQALVNNGAQTLQIFPASGDDLGAGVDTAETLAAGEAVVYRAFDGTTWFSAGGGGGGGTDYWQLE